MQHPSPQSATGLDPALALYSRIAGFADKLPDALLLIDSGWRIIYANAAAHRISRFTPAHFHGDTIWDLYPHLNDNEVGRAYRDVARTGIGQTVENFYSTERNLFFDLHILPLEDGIGILYNDVTHQKNKDQELRDSEERYRVLTELSPQSLWTANPEGLVLYANQRFLAYIGFEFVPKTGTEYIACFDPEDQARVVEVWTNSVITGEDYAIDARLIRASDGSSRWWHLRALPVRDAEGRIEQWLGSAVDIHDERLVQQRLIDQMAQQSKAEAALVQSEKLAAVGRMASSIAHEINNPLESVMNLIFLARSYAVNPDAQKFLEMADQELRRVSSIANQTLRFHKQASNPRAITASDLFSTVLSLYEGRLRNSSIEVNTSRLGGSPVACFEGDIRQVLNNLVGNAVDAMPNGGRLHLRARDATDRKTNRRGLLLTVADTGSGMSPETQARIFEAFFTTKGISGTGLGLWISSGIMDRHNGRLHLRSRQGSTTHGSVFTLFLPLESDLTGKS